MQRLYGNTLRKDAGVTKTLRNVAARNAHVLGGVTRGVKEVQGTFEKVLEETAEAVEEFLNKCEFWTHRGEARRRTDLDTQTAGPRVKGYVNDTKILLKQSGERFVIRFVYSFSVFVLLHLLTPPPPHPSVASPTISTPTTPPSTRSTSVPQLSVPPLPTLQPPALPLASTWASPSQWIGKLPRTIRARIGLASIDSKLTSRNL